MTTLVLGASTNIQRYSNIAIKKLLLNKIDKYDLVTGVDNQWLIAVSAYNLATWHINFGGYTTMTISSAATDANGYGTFEYAPPSGYYALCTKNLAEYG